MTTTKAKKTFKTMRGMEMTANKLMSAINQRLKIFYEPASIEINRSCGKYIEVEVSNRNTYMLTMVEVDIVREVVNDLLKDYNKDCWYIKFDTTPMYCPGTESFLHIPTMVIVLMVDDIEPKEK